MSKFIFYNVKNNEKPVVKQMENMQTPDSKAGQTANGQNGLHPLEETVLSLATGKLYQLEPAKPRLFVIP